MRVFDGIGELREHVGEHIGFSDWHDVTQRQVDLFAAATGDHQWIHVDQQRAAKGPFGSTIAHGYLTLAMLPSLVSEIYAVTDLSMLVNYGVNKVRFTAPVPVGSALRAGGELLSVDLNGDHAQVVLRVVVERGGHDKPVCVADTVSRLVR
ncbi:MaoC family dehydratase [Streptomyces sp. NPDC086777]|uniref:MaoC family dehydratase n=1 Tax=Streptomyces sp. NPDC086777 TaxID=3154866 RepID=UPI00344C5769